MSLYSLLTGIPVVMRAFFALALLCLAGASLPAQAQRVQARVSADSVRVGDRFELTLYAVHEGAATPLFPTPGDSLRFGDLEVLAVRGGGRSSSADSIVYEVTTFALDTAFVPPIPVRFGAEGDTVTAATGPFLIPVASLVPPEAEGVRDLAPLVDFPRAWWPWLLGALVLLAALAWFYYYWKRRRQRPAPVAAAPPPPPVAPFEEALARLRALAETPLDRPEHVKPYYVALSDLIRHYLARRTGVNALEETTRELLQELSRHPAFPADGLRQLRPLLELADFVKFADARPPEDRSRRVLEETRAALERIEAALRPRETPAAAPVQR